MVDAKVKMAAELNAVRVTVEDLRLASAEVHKLFPEDRDWEGRLHLIVRLFPGESLKASAVDFRLTAMARLVAAGAISHWILAAAADGSTSIAEPIWKATATAPLLLDDNEAYFDPKSFVKIALAAAPYEGRA